jgi:tRNA U55 pseudouridine synthase TruB
MRKVLAQSASACQCHAMAQENYTTELAKKLYATARSLVSRVPGDQDGKVLGWSGFHVELDEIERLCKELRGSVRR